MIVLPFVTILEKSPNSRDAGDLRRHRAHSDVTVMIIDITNVFRVSDTYMWYRSQYVCNYQNGVIGKT